MRDPIGVRRPDHIAFSIHGSISGFHGDLRAAIAIKVIHHELGVVGTGADIPAQIDPPEPFTVQSIGIDQGVTRIATLGVIFCV